MEKLLITLHKKWSFPLQISSVNVTKSVMENFNFLQCYILEWNNITNIQLCISFWFGSRHQKCSVEKVFLEISQNSQKNTCARVSFLIKLCALGLQLY